jgi:hypothetical protein
MKKRITNNLSTKTRGKTEGTVATAIVVISTLCRISVEAVIREPDEGEGA